MSYAEPHTPRILSARTANKPATVNDKLNVIIPSFGPHQWEVAGWLPRDAAIPATGTECAVILDERGVPWLASWAN